MGKNNIKSLTVLLLLTIACNSNDSSKDDFYTRKMRAGDVWRFPIAKPFELITAYCCPGWNTALSKEYNAPGKIISPDSINFQKGFIRVYRPSFNVSWGVIDIENKKFYSFQFREEFTDFLLSRHMSSDLIHTDTAYQTWLRTGNLPWEDEIVRDTVTRSH